MSVPEDLQRCRTAGDQDGCEAWNDGAQPAGQLVGSKAVGVTRYLDVEAALIGLLNKIGQPERAPWQQSDLRRCASCKGLILWIKTKSGKASPIDLDGETHWATCPDAAKFKSSRRETS